LLASSKPPCSCKRHGLNFRKAAIIVAAAGAVNRPLFTLPWTAPIVKRFTPAGRASRYGLWRPDGPASENRFMSTRRMAYWWWRFVVSGRFIEKFFNLRRSRRR
jgi:hypothetical protein